MTRDRAPGARRRLDARALHVLLPVCALVGLTVGCADDTDRARAPATSDGRWADIDTGRPSEDPVATVYGYVQAMAAGDDARACSFQYLGSSDHDADTCVLADEMPVRDRHFAAHDWAAFAGYALDDYEARDDHGWQVSLPTEAVTTWRITQDDAGIWFIDRAGRADVTDVRVRRTNGHGPDM